MSQFRYIFLFFVSLSALAGVRSLTEIEIEPEIEGLEQVYSFARAFLCNWKGGHEIDDDKEWFDDFLRSCSE